MTERISSFEEFWPYYLGEHRSALSRAFHYTGTIAAWGVLAAGILVSPWWLLAVLPAGYGPAWIGHFFIEHNKPATFKYPLWSLLADYRMFGLALTGRLGPELARAIDHSVPSTSVHR